MIDVDAIGRRTHRRGAPGETNGRARLTAEQVERIRRHSRFASDRFLAARYGVAYSTIGRIRRGETWTKVR